MGGVSFGGICGVEKGRALDGMGGGRDRVRGSGFVDIRIKLFLKWSYLCGGREYGRVGRVGLC